MKKCIIKNCVNNSENDNEQIVFFRFPSNYIDIIKWCETLDLSIEQVLKEKERFICALHFDECDINRSTFKTCIKRNCTPMAIEFLEENDNIIEDLELEHPTATGLNSDFDSYNNHQELDVARQDNRLESIELTEDYLESDFTFEADLDMHINFMECDVAPQSNRFESNNLAEEYLESDFSFEAEISDLNNIAGNVTAKNKNVHIMYKKYKNAINKKNNQIRNLKKKMCRKVVKITNMKSLLKILKDKNYINDRISNSLEKMEIPNSVFNRLISGKKCKYSRNLQIFATTVHFYSPKAYNYIRQTFNKSLPHPATIRKWYSNVNCEPGFIQQSFNSLEVKARLMKSQKKKCLCTLVVDEMSIMKRIELVGNKIRGYVDFGLNNEENVEDEATEAYVFMVVSINAHWKIPVAYFFTHNLDGNERANLVSDAISRLQAVGVEVVCLTCDGPPSNKAMLRILGSNINLPNPAPYFTTAERPNDRIYTMLDACHCLKLIRNNFASKKVFHSETGAVKWTYIEKLYKLQEKEDMKLANKLSKTHIEWKKNIMKVKYAAQTLSASVADAIEFCNIHLKLPEFAGSEATVEFIRKVDIAFDLLNSRNPYSQGSKAPINERNYLDRIKEIASIQSYILELKNEQGTNIYKTNISTGFQGLVIGLEILKLTYEELCITKNALKYILSYKFSQDHLELFFCAIRSRSGWNNNPTVRQFIAAFKGLLTHAQIKCSGGNVEELDSCSILNISSNSVTVRRDDMYMVLDSSDDLHLRNVSTFEDDFSSKDAENLIDIFCNGLSEFQVNVVGYIGGYVVKMVNRIIKCYECKKALLAENAGAAPTVNHLIFQKTRGALIIPSADVTYICLQTEKILREYIELTDIKNLTEKVALSVLRSIYNRNLFPTLGDHIKDLEADNNHIYKLTKSVIYAYLKIKISYIIKKKNLEKNYLIRNQLSRYIIFKNQ